ncbi:hypothetical protein ACFLZP_03605 [Patescibacteria group bacterium]
MLIFRKSDKFEFLKPQGISTVLVLGVIAILVTIVVPLASRSVIDVRINKQQEEQVRAFSAAEVGLEKALIGEDLEGDIGDIHYQVTESSTKSGAGEVFVYPKLVKKNQPVTVWLLEHLGVAFDPEADFDLSGNHYQENQVNLYWGQPGTVEDNDETPALEVTLFYQDLSNNFKVERSFIDPNISRASTSGFDSVVQVGDVELFGSEFRFQKNGLALNCDLGRTCYAMRLRLLYSQSDHPLAIEGVGASLPRQGVCKQSLATVTTSGITSRLQRCVFYKDFPGIFDFSLYSQTNLEK